MNPPFLALVSEGVFWDEMSISIDRPRKAGGPP